MSQLPCPRCQNKTKVADTRLKDGIIRRRYLCESGHRFGTIEMISPEGRKKESAIHAYQREQAALYVTELGKKLHAAIETITGVGR